jgi:hypothetical protein
MSFIVHGHGNTEQVIGLEKSKHNGNLSQLKC